MSYYAVLAKAWTGHADAMPSFCSCKQLTAGTWKYPCGKGETSKKRPIFGVHVSYLVFRGVSCKCSFTQPYNHGILLHPKPIHESKVSNCQCNCTEGEPKTICARNTSDNWYFLSFLSQEWSVRGCWRLIMLRFWSFFFFRLAVHGCMARCWFGSLLSLLAYSLVIFPFIFSG